MTSLMTYVCGLSLNSIALVPGDCPLVYHVAKINPNLLYTVQILIRERKVMNNDVMRPLNARHMTLVAD